MLTLILIIIRTQFSVSNKVFNVLVTFQFYVFYLEKIPLSSIGRKPAKKEGRKEGSIDVSK